MKKATETAIATILRSNLLQTRKMGPWKDSIIMNYNFKIRAMRAATVGEVGLMGLKLNALISRVISRKEQQWMIINKG